MDELEAMKFDLEIPADKWKARVKPMLANYKMRTGNHHVPRDYVIPTHSRNNYWEEKDKGIQLGKLVYNHGWTRMMK